VELPEEVNYDYILIKQATKNGLSKRWKRKIAMQMAIDNQ